MNGARALYAARVKLCFLGGGAASMSKKEALYSRDVMVHSNAGAGGLRCADRKARRAPARARGPGAAATAAAAAAAGSISQGSISQEPIRRRDQAARRPQGVGARWGRRLGNPRPGLFFQFGPTGWIRCTGPWCRHLQKKCGGIRLDPPRGNRWRSVFMVATHLSYFTQRLVTRRPLIKVGCVSSWVPRTLRGEAS